jgi:hypothetical protein
VRNKHNHPACSNHSVPNPYPFLPKGKAAIDILRSTLSEDVRNVLCPLRNGGVSLHKLYGVMHDTCNCANKVSLISFITIIFIALLNRSMGIKVATLMMKLRDQKCKAHFGEDVWALASSKTKAIFNFVCGNHAKLTNCTIQ